MDKAIKTTSQLLDSGISSKTDFALHFLLKYVLLVYQQNTGNLPDIPSNTKFIKDGFSSYPFIELVFIILRTYDKEYNQLFSGLKSYYGNADYKLNTSIESEEKLFSMSGRVIRQLLDSINVIKSSRWNNYFNCICAYS